jgi:hypothetical protein
MSDRQRCELIPIGQRLNWRAHLEVHPAVDLFPPIPEEQFAELAHDIAEHGLQAKVQLVVGTDGSIKLVDGRNRLDALAALGWLEKVEPPAPKRGRKPKGDPFVPIAATKIVSLFQFQNNLADADVSRLALSLNLRRRHLNAEQREAAIAKIIALDPEKSDRQYAKEIGVDHKTIGKARAKGEDVGSIPHVEKRTDSRGRKQPAQKVPAEKKPAEGASADETSQVSADKRKAENEAAEAAGSKRALSKFVRACDVWLPEMDAEDLAAAHTHYLAARDRLTP